MKNVIVIVLLIVGIYLAVQGVRTIQSASNDVEILGLEISADDKDGQTTGMLYLGLGLVALVGGYFVWKKQ